MRLNEGKMSYQLQKTFGGSWILVKKSETMLEICLHFIGNLYPKGTADSDTGGLRSRKLNIPKSPDYGILQIKRGGSLEIKGQ